MKKAILNPAKDWNPKQKHLRELLGQPEKFSEAMRLCLAMHASVHAEYEDALWDGLDETTFRFVPEKRVVSIAWDLWHITRIEDLTANILIADGPQVFGRDWLKKCGVKIMDTGNAMTEREVREFSRLAKMKALREYRAVVGTRTQKVLRSLEPGDRKRKFRPDQLERIIREGGVLDVPGSRWLVDFWGRKTVAGILLMPITRHQAVHLNDAVKLKEKYSS